MAAGRQDGGREAHAVRECAEAAAAARAGGRRAPCFSASLLCSSDAAMAFIGLLGQLPAARAVGGLRRGARNSIPRAVGSGGGG